MLRRLEVEKRRRWLAAAPSWDDMRRTSRRFSATAHPGWFSLHWILPQRGFIKAGEEEHLPRVCRQIGYLHAEEAYNDSFAPACTFLEARRLFEPPTRAKLARDIINGETTDTPPRLTFPPNILEMDASRREAKPYAGKQSRQLRSTDRMPCYWA